MKLFYFFIYVSILSLLTSCIGSDLNHSVLEKSVNQTPAWISENGKVNVEHPEFVNIVFSKSDLYNLPLGLKQSQTIASKKVSYLLFTEIHKQILQRYEKIKSKDEDRFNIVSKRIYQIINKNLNQFKINSPLASDIYWEHRQQENVHDANHYYVVWVLLLIPKTDYDRAFVTIAQELKNSKDDAIVILGNDILQQPEKR